MKVKVPGKHGFTGHRLPTKILLMMKLTIVFLIAACLHVNAAGFAQNVTISQRNMSLEKVFREIRKQTGYNFLYNVKMLEQAKKVNLEVKNEPLENVLDQCFNDQPLTYTIIEKTVVVKNRVPVQKEDNIAPIVTVDAGGIVTDAQGKPMQGVSIKTGIHLL